MAFEKLPKNIKNVDILFCRIDMKRNYKNIDISTSLLSTTAWWKRISTDRLRAKEPNLRFFIGEVIQFVTSRKFRFLATKSFFKLPILRFITQSGIPAPSFTRNFTMISCSSFNMFLVFYRSTVPPFMQNSIERELFNVQSWNLHELSLMVTRN